MISQTLPSKELRFIHITKCAGTFIECIGKEHKIPWGICDKEYGFWHQIFVNKPISVKEKYDWFVIVRNPYDRLISEYHCKWGGIGGKIIQHTKEEFNEYLIKKINKRSSTGDHYTEQYKYIDPTSTITIIKFENLYNELHDLFKKYNININIRKYREQKNKRAETLFKINDCNTELLTLINNVYDMDFKMFNYKKIVPSHAQKK